ncbi:MAG: MBL fold metallo-hydrolase, partial [Myxococcales bacterium]|nr:MBL fold metallo-hydrolase [Myxococcales bacterium]
MIFQRFIDEGLSQMSYVVACPRTHKALVVDPTRDIDRYVTFARKRGLNIVYVAETHLHADFVSGARELAMNVDGALLASEEGGADWAYRISPSQAVRLLRHGDRADLGDLCIEAVHVPGHSPEHLAYSVLQSKKSPHPRLVMTGDFLFVGDVGRPDLLDAGDASRKTARDMSAQMYESLRERLGKFGDEVLVWPGHGAGSACGRATSDLPCTTVGHERRASWWSTFIANNDLEGFVEQLSEAQPEVPRYFKRTKLINRDGPAELGQLPVPPRLFTSSFHHWLGLDAEVLDLRPTQQFARLHPKGAQSFPSLSKLSSHAGAVLQDAGRPIVLVASPSQLEAATRGLVRVGFDRLVGWVSPEDAIDALGGRGTVRVITRCEASFAMVEVADDGPGIPPEVRPRSL